MAGLSVTNHLQTLGGEEVLSALLLMRDVLVTPVFTRYFCQVLPDTLVTAVTADAALCS